MSSTVNRASRSHFSRAACRRAWRAAAMPTRLIGMCLGGALAAGCATVEHPDPLESMNRKVYAFNDGLDKAVVKPAAQAYARTLPMALQSGIRNFFSNLGDPWSGLNLMLQGRFQEGLSDFGRFGTNTIVGGLGFADPASGWGMPHHGGDFGQTLGVWGVQPGAYLVLPVLGPSDLRDFAALPVDTLGHPQSYINSLPVEIGVGVVQGVSKRANLLKAGDLLNDIALDKYIFVRDAYLQRRRSRVFDADPTFMNSSQPSCDGEPDRAGAGSSGSCGPDPK